MHNSVPLTGKKHNDYVKWERCGRDEPRAHCECSNLKADEENKTSVISAQPYFLRSCWRPNKC